MTLSLKRFAILALVAFLGFTFGQSHVHFVNGRTFDRNIVVKITADDPRQVMFDTFGRQWGHEYDKEPPMKYFWEIVEL